MSEFGDRKRPVNREKRDLTFSTRCLAHLRRGTCRQSTLASSIRGRIFSKSINALLVRYPAQPNRWLVRQAHNSGNERNYVGVLTLSAPSRPLILKDLPQSSESDGESILSNGAQPADQPRSVKGTELIKENKTGASAKKHRDASRGRSA